MSRKKAANGMLAASLQQACGKKKAQNIFTWVACGVRDVVQVAQSTPTLSTGTNDRICPCMVPYPTTSPLQYPIVFYIF